MAAKVEITPKAYAEAEALHEPMYTRVMAIIERLENWPAVSGAKPLRGSLVGHFRIRTGDYRVQFHVKGAVIVVERIGHRDGFYED